MFNFFGSKKPQKIKTLGQLGEEFAQEEYKKCGYKIIAKNEYNKKGRRLGEIDFIAADKQRIIFVEVKTRTSGANKFGGGAEAVNSFKQVKLLRAVKMYFLRHREYQNLIPQIDVCLVENQQLDKQPFSAIIIPNAVEDWN